MLVFVLCVSASISGTGGTLPEQHCGAENEGLGPLGGVWGPAGCPGCDLLRFGGLPLPKSSPFWTPFFDGFRSWAPKNAKQGAILVDFEGIGFLSSFISFSGSKINQNPWFGPRANLHET